MATNNQQYNALGRGIASMFGGNGQARQAGEMAGLQQIALEDQIAGDRTTADLNRVKLEEAERARQMAGPKQALTRVAQLFNVPTDNVGDLEAWQKTGRLPENLMQAPAAPMGGMGPVQPPSPPSWGTPENLTKIAQAFFADQSAQAGSAKTMKDAIEALLLQPKIALTSGVADGSTSPQVGGARFAALEGKPLVTGNEYGVTDNFTGAVNDSGPVAQRFGQYRQEQTAAQKANAAQSYASADSSRASAEKTRQETQQGGRTGNIQVVTDGTTGNITLVDKGTGLARPAVGLDGKPIAGKGSGKTGDATKDANEAISIIDQAYPLLDSATGSYAGAGVDQVGRLIGVSTPGAQSASRLKALEGMLVSKMPKMSGPQSDKDVALYRQMAAVIGDETIPSATRKAALDTVREIQVRYAGDPNGGRQAPPPAPGQGQPVRITNEADYAALKPGTRFVTPDGKTGTKR